MRGKVNIFKAKVTFRNPKAKILVEFLTLNQRTCDKGLYFVSLKEVSVNYWKSFYDEKIFHNSLFIYFRFCPIANHLHFCDDSDA